MNNRADGVALKDGTVRHSMSRLNTDDMDGAVNVFH
jgi:hypothetical protein